MLASTSRASTSMAASTSGRCAAPVASLAASLRRHQHHTSSLISSTHPQQHGSAARSAVVARAEEGFCRDKVSAPRAAVASKGVTYKLRFVGAGGEVREVPCPDDSYILDAAEASGLDLPATCRGGICGACVARVTKGTVDMSDIDDLSFTVSEEEQAQGMTLLCMARATSDVELETQSDWGYSLGVGEWKGATGKFSSSPDPLMGTAFKAAKQ